MADNKPALFPITAFIVSYHYARSDGLCVTRVTVYDLFIAAPPSPPHGPACLPACLPARCKYAANISVSVLLWKWSRFEWTVCNLRAKYRATAIIFRPQF